jgi:ABC-type antimicrobial peptide transport system permease subunit
VARVTDAEFDRITAVRRFNAGLMSMFGLVGAVIAGLGVYATMSDRVAQNVRAIGLRMALGASPQRVMRTMLLDAFRLVAVGASVGLIMARAASGAARAMAFGVRPADIDIYLGVGGFLICIGLLGAFAPSLRAARLSPLEALRSVT